MVGVVGEADDGGVDQGVVDECEVGAIDEPIEGVVEEVDSKGGGEEE